MKVEELEAQNLKNKRKDRYMFATYGVLGSLDDESSWLLVPGGTSLCGVTVGPTGGATVTVWYTTAPVQKLKDALVDSGQWYAIWGSGTKGDTTYRAMPICTAIKIKRVSGTGDIHYSLCCQ